MSEENLENASDAPEERYYLMKAEPDPRIVEGKDVKFSVEDFEAAKTTAWEGVRNYTARNIMREMKIGEKVFFYHSNTKNPGIAGFAEVSREAYPDHTAWEKNHPYFDHKSDPSSPRWYMVDLRFLSRAQHFVSLTLLRHLSTLSNPPSELPYLTKNDLEAVKGMSLLSSSRLSVQKVEKPAWDAIGKIAKEGYECFEIRPAKKAKGKATGYNKPKVDAEENGGESADGDVDSEDKSNKKRKAPAGKDVQEGIRKSKRTKRQT